MTSLDYSVDLVHMHAGRVCCSIVLVVALLAWYPRLGMPGATDSTPV